MILTGMRPFYSSKDSDLSVEASIKRQIVELGKDEFDKFKFGTTHIPYFVVEKANRREVVNLLKILLSPKSKNRPSSTEAIRLCKELIANY